MGAIIEFNHNKSNFLEAIGFDEKRSLELENKIKNTALTAKIVRTHSQTTEMIAQEYSYQELLVIATMYILNQRIGG